MSGGELDVGFVAHSKHGKAAGCEKPDLWVHAPNVVSKARPVSRGLAEVALSVFTMMCRPEAMSGLRTLSSMMRFTASSSWMEGKARMKILSSASEKQCSLEKAPPPIRYKLYTHVCEV